MRLAHIKDDFADVWKTVQGEKINLVKIEEKGPSKVVSDQTGGVKTQRISQRT